MKLGCEEAGLWGCWGLFFPPKVSANSRTGCPDISVRCEVWWYRTVGSPIPVCSMSVTPAEVQLLCSLYNPGKLNDSAWVNTSVSPGFVHKAFTSFPSKKVISSPLFSWLAFLPLCFPMWTGIGEGGGSTVLKPLSGHVPISTGDRSHISSLSIKILSDCFICYVSMGTHRDAGSG